MASPWILLKQKPTSNLINQLVVYRPREHYLSVIYEKPNMFSSKFTQGFRVSSVEAAEIKNNLLFDQAIVRFYVKRRLHRPVGYLC